MARFPSNTTDPRFKPIYGINIRPIENVKRNAAELGKTQRRDVWGRTFMSFDSISFELPQRLAADLYYEYETLRSTTFTVFDSIERRRVAVNIGTGTGANLSFTIDAERTSLVVVKVNGVTKTAGLHYNLSAGTGTDGRDRVVFTAGNAPPVGQAVTVDYYGYVAYTCEFTGTPGERAGFKHNFVRLRFPIEEVR